MLVVKNLAANAASLGSVSGSGRFPGEGNDNPLPYSCLEHLLDREAWQATVHGSQRVGLDLMTKQQQQHFTGLCEELLKVRREAIESYWRDLRRKATRSDLNFNRIPPLQLLYQYYSEKGQYKNSETSEEDTGRMQAKNDNK